MVGDKTLYFKPLDGFRAIAAICVLLVHSHFVCFKALWIGVPMFFVLSGFLITRILVQNKGAKNYFRVFYFKRSLRIFPIYYLTLLFCIFWGHYSKADLTQTAYYALYLQNFLIASQLPPEFCAGLMRHSWSLSIEELFYLIWPLVVFMLDKKIIVRLSLTLVIANVLFKLLYVVINYEPSDEPFLMLSLFGNLDGLMIGSLLGVLSLNPYSFIYSKVVGKIFLFCSLLFFAVLVINYLPLTNNKVYYFFKILLSSVAAILSFFGIALIIANPIKQSSCFSFLASTPMVFIGKISYGLYLYHNIVYRMVDSIIYHFQFPVNMLFTFTLQLSTTFILAILSWNFIEKPLLGLKHRMHYIIN